MICVTLLYNVSSLVDSIYWLVCLTCIYVHTANFVLIQLEKGHCTACGLVWQQNKGGRVIHESQ